jgi:hypothetical protein
MKKLQTVFVLLLFFSAGQLHAQAIQALLEDYHKKVPQEKVYIHFDNSLYAPGQTVWYKAYLLKDFVPSDLSKNLYIDWLDETGTLISRSVAPVLNSIATGDFTVPEKYTGTRLQVMAYTKWMLNFDTSFLFHQTLRIAAFSKNGVSAALAGSIQNPGRDVPVTTLQFFPEGGDMVESVTGNLAFKALNSMGTPVPVSGTITNKNKQVVARFSSQHNGAGKLLFTPLPGEVYTAEWKDLQGNNQQTGLPAAKKTGIVLTVINHSATRQFIIERAAVLEERFKTITILGTMNQQLVSKAVVDLSGKNKVTVGISTADFPSGILQITLFDGNMLPVSERIVFVNNEADRLAASIQATALNLEKRGKNTYEVELADTVAATLSVSVTDGNDAYDGSQNILTQFLLSSEIKGHIHDPSYYFSSGEDSIARHLDLVMLTNGWRRFVWDDVMTGKQPQLKYTPDTGYLSITGKIDNITAGKIKKAAIMNIVLEAKDSSQQFLFTPIQPDGSFRQDNLVIFDTTKVYYKLNNEEIPLRSQVTISNTFLPININRNRSFPNHSPDTSGLARMRSIADQQQQLDSLVRLTTLKEVTVTTKVKTRTEEMEDQYVRSGVFRGGGNARSFNVADDTLGGISSSALAYLQGKVPGLQIRNTGGNPVLIWRGNTTQGSSVDLYLNEMRVDASTLLSIPMSNIAYIKTFPPPFIGASSGGAGGAIVVYTKKGSDVKAIQKGIDFVLLPGYTPFREFYSPNYAETEMNTSKPDLRRTLFWRSNILMDGINKKALFSFYNNDISHSFRIILEGMTTDGRLIYLNKLVN